MESPILLITILGILSGAATGVGGLVVIATKATTERMLSAMLGFASGIMLAVSFLGLIPQAIITGEALITFIGFLVGIILLLLADTYMPHIHLKAVERSDVSERLLKVGVLVAIGISIHNVPEGIAIGSGYLVTQRIGAVLAITIALHNIPEGLALAVPLYASRGFSRPSTFVISLLAGCFPTGFGALLAAVTLGAMPKFLLSAGLSIAAGAMVYITCDELIPESHRHGHEHAASLSLSLGALCALGLIKFL